MSFYLSGAREAEGRPSEVSKVGYFTGTRMIPPSAAGARPAALSSLRSLFKKMALLMLYSYSSGFFKEKSFEKMRLMSLFSK